MPYIKGEHRDKFRLGLNELPPAENAGELNYLFSKIAIQYIDYHGHRYEFMDDVVGALQNACTEFQRRVMAPYEDKKAEENGDIYGP